MKRDVTKDAGERRFERRVHETENGRITITALWNDAEKTVELSVITQKFGAHSHGWDATSGRFDWVLKSDGNYLIEKLLNPAERALYGEAYIAEVVPYINALGKEIAPEADGTTGAGTEGFADQSGLSSATEASLLNL